MKNAFLLPVLLCFSTFLLAQRVKPVRDKDYYLQKSTNLKTGAWVLAGLGPVALVTGILLIENNRHSSFNDFGNSLNGVFAGTLLTIVGSGAIVTSVPLFIRSGRMKKKADSIGLGKQTIFIPQQGNFALNIQPAVTVTIGL